MNLTAIIHDMVDHLEDSEKLLLVELLKRLIPDDVATPKDLDDIAIADLELAEGRAFGFDDIDWG